METDSFGMTTIGWMEVEKKCWRTRQARVLTFSDDEGCIRRCRHYRRAGVQETCSLNALRDLWNTTSPPVWVAHTGAKSQRNKAVHF